MRDFGSDINIGIILLLILLLAFPIVMFFPMATPFLISLPFFLFGYLRLKLYQGAHNWKRIDGQLIETEVGSYEVSQSQYSRQRYYFPLAYFSYLVNGKEYESNQYALDRKSIWTIEEENAKQLVEDLGSLDNLDVFVNPNNPYQAVINKSIAKKRRSEAYALIVVALMCSGLGVFLIVWGWEY